MRSILQSQYEEACYFCGSKNRLEEHHIYGGSNRKVSEKNGFKLYLCKDCHLEVTDNENWKSKWLKWFCQAVYELLYSRDDFMKLIGRNYQDLDDHEQRKKETKYVAKERSRWRRAV